MLHIFDTLSTADIRFLSVDVSGFLSLDVSEQHTTDIATAPSHASSAAHQSVDKVVARWRQIVERERCFQNEWRDELRDVLFKSSKPEEMMPMLQLPQIWAVTEKQEKDSTSSPDSPPPVSFKSFRRVPLCKVTILFHASLQSEKRFSPYFYKSLLAGLCRIQDARISNARAR